MHFKYFSKIKCPTTTGYLCFNEMTAWCHFLQFVNHGVNIPVVQKKTWWDIKESHLSYSSFKRETMS